jgi:type III pantothenate kinase
MVGTAVTVEGIDATGRFLGGLILPGHGIMLRALESGTAGLHVPTGEVRDFPTNTSDALTSGGTFAIAGAMDRMVQNLQQPLRRRSRVFHDGWRRLENGPQHVAPFELVENLMFDGLLEMAQRRFS